VLVGPDRVAEWVDAMRPLAFDADARAALVSAALMVAGTLTWRRTAERTVRAYREAGAAV
jgi:hypothetical protein